MTSIIFYTIYIAYIGNQYIVFYNIVFKNIFTLKKSILNKYLQNCKLKLLF